MKRKICLGILLTLFLALPAYAENSEGKKVDSLDQVPGNIESKEGLSVFQQEMNGDTRPDGFGTKLPEGVTAATVVRLLVPDADPSLSTLTGMKKWPYEKDTYIAFACIAPDQESYPRAIKYNNNHPICEPWLVSKENTEYTMALGMIRYEDPSSKPTLISATVWTQNNDNPLAASWRHSNLDGPAGINVYEGGADPKTAQTPTGIYQFDFAPFNISETITAFGIRSGMNEGYAGGGANFQVLTLFALIDGQLKPVLSEPIYYFKNLAGEWHEDGTRDHHLYEGENIINVLPQATDGFYNLEIRSKEGNWHKIFTWNRFEQRYRTEESDSHCKASEVEYFSCKIKDSAKVLSLCGINEYPPNDKKEGWLQYRFGKPGQPELVFPENKEGSLGRFDGFWSPPSVRFKNGEADYEVSADAGENGFYGVRATIQGKSAEFPCDGSPPNNISRDMAKLLIIKGANVNAKGSDGTTPLHWAANSTVDLYVTKLLIEKGADVNASSVTGETPLHRAVAAKRADKVSLLIAKGANVNVQNAKGETPLSIAAAAKDTELTRLLMEKGADAKSLKAQLLCQIIEYGPPDLAKLLIKYGMDVKGADNNGNTPLHVAAYKGSTDIAQLLIEKGANVNAPNGRGETPLVMVAHGSYMNKNSLDVAKLLIEKRANINAKNNNGETPLYAAVNNRSIDLIKLLIEKGANVNIKDAGQTPLNAAVYTDNPNIVNLLIEKRANLNAKDSRGLTPLHIAIDRKSIPVARLLIEKGADVNAEGFLAQAMFKESEDIVKLLIAKGANVNAKSYRGMTLLSAAILDRSNDIAELLIENGADVNAGQPLFLAIKNGSVGLVRSLVKHGANVNAGYHDVYDSGTLFELAIKNGSGDIARLLIENGLDLDASMYTAISKGSIDLVRLMLDKGAHVNGKRNKVSGISA